MKTIMPRVSGRPARGRSRLVYDRLWRDVATVRVSASPKSYWETTRQPIPCLVFVLPLIAAYEIGIAAIGGRSADSLRTGADSWVRHALSQVGFTDRWLPPIALVGALVGWQAFRVESWKFRPRCLLGMVAESLVFAIGLVGLSRLVEIGFARLDTSAILDASATSSSLSSIVGYIGAGVYEEAIFRLGLIPLFYAAARLIHAPKVFAGTLAVTISALLFSLAHHAGAPGETFTLFAFIFRWLAGIGFAWIFLVRGFGVAVGAHAAYDILVGWVGLHF